MSKITDLKFDEKNFNKGTQYGKSLMDKSFSKFGAGRSILIDKHNNIIAGNKSTETFAEMGLNNVQIVDTDGKTLIAVRRNDIDLDTPEGREFAVADNQTAKTNIDFDFEMLESEIGTDTLEEWGVEFPEQEILEAEEDDFDAAPPENPITVLGDLYEIGEHRLLCGDSTDSDQVAKLMNGDKADMVFTDPPYGMKLDTDYSGMSGGDRKGKTYDKVIGDNEDFKPELITTIFANFDYCKEIFIWGVDYYFDLILNFKDGALIVWDKTLQANGDAGYNSEFELCWSKNPHKKEVIHFNWFRFFGLSSQDIKTRVHPTQKPLQVITPYLKKHTEENNIIVDLYFGSGSTMVAAHQLKRKCYGIELDPKYCDVIVRRMLKLEPSMSLKRNGKVIDHKEFTTE